MLVTLNVFYNTFAHPHTHTYIQTHKAIYSHIIQNTYEIDMF